MTLKSEFKRDEEKRLVLDKGSNLIRYKMKDGTISKDQFTHPKLALEALRDMEESGKELSKEARPDPSADTRAGAEHGGYSNKEPNSKAQQAPAAGDTKQEKGGKVE
jgi:hypothetical protein